MCGRPNNQPPGCVFDHALAPSFIPVDTRQHRIPLDLRSHNPTAAVMLWPIWQGGACYTGIVYRWIEGETVKIALRVANRFRDTDDTYHIGQLDEERIIQYMGDQIPIRT